MPKRGNISILVIFVLLASSLLGILAMNYVQQMMKQSAMINSYYKTYYLSKAGIELGLAQLQYRDIGFQSTIATGDEILSSNFLCSPHCQLSLSISGMSSILSQKFRQEDIISGCVAPYLLSGGDSLIVPLFSDVTTGNVATMFDNETSYQNLANLLKDDQIDIISEFGDEVTFGILILSGQDLYEHGVFFKTGSLTTASLQAFRMSFEAYMAGVYKDFANYYSTSQLIEKGYKMYLMISNSSHSPQSLCIKTISNTPLVRMGMLPTDTFFLQSHAGYSRQEVVLDASYAQPIPGFLFSSYSAY